MKDIPPIYFYMHEHEMPVGGVPDDADVTWSGFIDYINKPGAGRTTAICSYCWSLQTFLYLRQAGFKCEITTTIPDEGIIIGHRTAIPFNLKPKRKQLIVCVKADFESHYYTQLHIVQNPQDTKHVRDSFFIPHWPQPGLKARDPNRGNKFENIAYFGVDVSLAPELLDPSWSARLKSMGLNWLLVGEERWYDYSNVDAVIAVRSFDKQEYKHKPASKLYNAWLAGVPAILGPDSAFRAEYQSHLDYIEVTSIDETIAALQRLQDNQLYQAMVKNGIARGEKISSQTVIEKWKQFLTSVAIPEYYRWCELSSLQQKLWLARQNLIVVENHLRPNPYYPYEFDSVNNDHIGIQDSVIVSTMQMYRKVKNLVAR